MRENEELREKMREQVTKEISALRRIVLEQGDLIQKLMERVS